MKTVEHVIVDDNNFIDMNIGELNIAVLENSLWKFSEDYSFQNFNKVYSKDSMY